MTTSTDLIAAHQHSSRHRQEIAASKICGCFHCLETYASAEIVQWVDNGDCAVCPRCGIDSVIGNASGLPVEDPSFLDAMNRHWFGGVDESLWEANGMGVRK